MTENEMQRFIDEHQELISSSDRYYLLYQQAKAARKAVYHDVKNGSPTAATDLLILTIGQQCFPVGCFNADVTTIIDDALFQIMQCAVEEIHLADPNQIV